MIRIGIALGLFFWMSLTLAAHPQSLQAFIVDLALVVPIIFLIIYLRTLGLLFADLRRYLRVRFFVWHSKKNKDHEGGIPSTF